MPFAQKSKLPRLDREWYQGHASVLWTHTFENRATGWLDGSFAAHFREILLHASARHQLVCPAYVLMPDHFHIIWLGLRPKSDQRLATAFLRQHLTPILRPASLQDRAHDHVLREHERERGALEATCHYVRENPVRAGLVGEWKAWPYSGAMIPGYPDLNPRDPDFIDRFWRIHERLLARA